MLYTEQVKRILGDTLNVPVQMLKADTVLLGNLPEFDSMAVLSVVAALEDRFGIVVEDDELHARHFTSVGSLAAFVQEKLEE